MSLKLSFPGIGTVGYLGNSEPSFFEKNKVLIVGASAISLAACIGLYLRSHEKSLDSKKDHTHNWIESLHSLQKDGWEIPHERETEK